jgi:hypothetical protein
MQKRLSTVSKNLESAQAKWGDLLTETSCATLRWLTNKYLLNIDSGDLILLNGHWYVTHSGLIGLASRHRCQGIRVEPTHEFCDPALSRWAFKATVFRSRCCKGFVGYGDADPSNVSLTMRGSELRIAETRAVNRALRKAYGIGMCSVEELGASRDRNGSEVPKFPARSVASNGNNGHHPGPRVRDRLCQIIRSHNLDPELVKSYAVSFCGTKTLREAKREQVEAFVAHLGDWAEKDRNALLCQLNSFQRFNSGVA